MKLLDRKGNEVEVTFEKEYAKVGEVVVVALTNNKVRIWNDLLLDQASLQTVKNEMSKQIKKVETGKRK